MRSPTLNVIAPLPPTRDRAAGSPPDAPARRRWWTSRRALVGALAASVVVHLAFSLFPALIPGEPDQPPLQVAITELPPPPTPAAAAPAPKPKRVPRSAPVTTPEPAPVAAVETSPTEPVAEAAPTPEPAAVPEPAAPPAETVATAPEAAPAEPPPKALPPRVDLGYKVFLGTQGFLIGEATYRFEHSGLQYQMETIGEARGLAALLVRGQGKIQSRGIITPTGLQPIEFAIERGSADRREVALFDWTAGVVTLHEQKTAALERPTYDPLALMWQFYFSPPVADAQTFSVATTRRVASYTITREATEKITWVNGEIDTERWHRKSLDGKTDGYVWLAPSLHYIPVKMRLVATNRGTIEALLDSIRIDEPVAQQTVTPQ